MSNLKQQEMSITVYFNQMKSLVDSLMSTEQPLHDEKFMSYHLFGLDNDYDADALYQVVNSRTTAMPIRDLFAQLVATEHKIVAHRAELGMQGHSSV
jgi:hypothetical protein